MKQRRQRAGPSAQGANFCLSRNEIANIKIAVKGVDCLAQGVLGLYQDSLENLFCRTPWVPAQYCRAFRFIYEMITQNFDKSPEPVFESLSSTLFLEFPSIIRHAITIE